MNGTEIGAGDDTFNGIAFLVPDADLLSGTNTISVEMVSDDESDDGVRVQFSQDTASPLSATPLPGALPLFAGGLGALGLLGRRRKLKNPSTLVAA